MITPPPLLTQKRGHDLFEGDIFVNIIHMKLLCGIFQLFKNLAKKLLAPPMFPKKSPNISSSMEHISMSMSRIFLAVNRIDNNKNNNNSS